MRKRWMVIEMIRRERKEDRKKIQEMRKARERVRNRQWVRDRMKGEKRMILRQEVREDGDERCKEVKEGRKERRMKEGETEKWNK